MMAWLPVFFMYFNQNLTISEVLVLESIYYISVVLLEVPSGYFSDKVGRRVTLLISSICFTLAYVFFGFLDPSYFIFVCAQILLALGMSFMSGTNTSFFFESLQELNRDNEFSALESNVQGQKQLASAGAVLLGGIVAYYNLRYAYVLSFVFSLPTIFICYNFKEPQKEVLTDQKNSFYKQIVEVLRLLKIKELKWIFIYSVVLYVISHIPYEFYQGYLTIIDETLPTYFLPATIMSGLIFALTRLFGSYAAYNSTKWVSKYGLLKVCILALLVQLLIIFLMGNVLHASILLIILMRSVSMSLTLAPLNAEIAPRLNKNLRASYFSLQSLCSRLAFSFCLLTLSFTSISQDVSNWNNYSQLMIKAFFISLAISLTLLFIKPGRLFTKSN